MKYLERYSSTFPAPIVRQIRQLLCFGAVGGMSTLLNSIIFVSLVDFLKIPAQLGNLFAFLSAFLVSYFGHLWWTFGNKPHSVARFIKFLAISLCGLTLNSCFVWITMHRLHQSAYVATLPMIFITPLLIFVINKFWVFKDTSPELF
jgi:putative flippase GtrA